MSRLEELESLIDLTMRLRMDPEFIKALEMKLSYVEGEYN